ncbi:hypothetical protein ACFOQM_10620 [Paenibacillus sp. GCM10012307]|uniref:Uncharacterized protein n=1 Tax=Paenibacillus roseus TaxID=2798579 RepID=A0A934IYV2_9BACL|nr:hypothetical protein [Paenibacillus roseus]MBJ6361742.1 hypothetical protein [Paenibacillus roseus]
MLKNFPKLSIAIYMMVILSFVAYMLGYRLDGLSAARANAFVPKNSVLLDEVKFSWGGVYIFDSSEKPVTAISIKKYGLLWSSNTSVWHYNYDDPIKTIGSISLNNAREKATVISVLVNDSNISYIEAGPEGNRINKQTQSREPITLSWDEAVQVDRLSPKAFDKNGKLLYEYRYKETNFIRHEDLRWYPVTDI